MSIDIGPFDRDFLTESYVS